MEPERTNLPAQIADALVSIPSRLTPGVVKALDRLLGATVDIPAAWLAQKKARIDAQTESYRLVEAAIAQAAASGAGADPETAQRAMNVLVRKEYQKQLNREAVAVAMVEDMREHVAGATEGNAPHPTDKLDDDWLNVFERYAEDASSESLQGLWGRVLSGEIRRPGRFSRRTLRFLSEVSQADALAFETFAKCAFGDAAPKNLVVSPEGKDIRALIDLESNGLVQGASGLGLTRTVTFNQQGYAALAEGELLVALKGEPSSKFSYKIVTLTPFGQELLGLVASRDPREAAKAVARALRDDKIHEAYLGVRANDDGKFHLMEVLWIKESPGAPIVDGTTS